MNDTETLTEFAAYVESHFSKQDVFDRKIENGVLSYGVLKSEFLTVLQFLRDDPACKCDCLLDVTALDTRRETDRFALVYHLLSTVYERVVRLKIYTDFDLPVVSVTSVYPSANWYEREIWDMFGIAFSEHDDMRRILTDEGFHGEPLKKDFRLSGERVLRFDATRGMFYYTPAKNGEDVKNQSKVTELGR